MTTQAITLNSNAAPLVEAIANEVQKAKQIVVNIRSLENIDQQVMAAIPTKTVMCPW